MMCTCIIDLIGTHEYEIILNSLGYIPIGIVLRNIIGIYLMVSTGAMDHVRNLTHANTKPQQIVNIQLKHVKYIFYMK